MKRLCFPCFRSVTVPVRCRSDTVATRNTTHDARDDSAAAVHDLRRVSSSVFVPSRHPVIFVIVFFFSFVFAIFYTLPPHSPFTVPFTTTTTAPEYSLPYGDTIEFDTYKSHSYILLLLLWYTCNSSNYNIIYIL